MTTEHDGVRDLLAAWAFGALDPADRRTVPLHLAECESCAAEAQRLRETVRLLDGPASNGPDRPAAGILSGALRTRPAAPLVAPHAAPYAAAVTGLKALLPEIEGRWSTPVVHDWDVHATLAHLLAADEHLARLLGLGTRLPLSRIPPDTHWGRPGTRGPPRSSPTSTAVRPRRPSRTGRRRRTTCSPRPRPSIPNRPPAR